MSAAITIPHDYEKALGSHTAKWAAKKKPELYTSDIKTLLRY
jgi:hypothetical protein